MATSPTHFSRSPLCPTCTAISAVILAVALSVAVVAAAGQQDGQQQQGQTKKAAQPQRGPSGLGRPPTQAEVRTWDLSISPDGTELPPGSGNATTSAPVVALPLPGGNSVPSGLIDRSHVRTSAWVGGRPRPDGPRWGWAAFFVCPCCCCPSCWPAAATTATDRATARMTALIAVHVGHSGDRLKCVGDVAIAVDPPRRDPIRVSELAYHR